MHKALGRTGLAFGIVLGAGLALAACEGGIHASPEADRFNAELDLCQRHSTLSRRNACANAVMQRYGRQAR